MYWAHSGLPTWVAHLGPISARRTLCFGSEVGHPSGAHKAVQMGPTWDPYRIPVGEVSRKSGVLDCTMGMIKYIIHFNGESPSYCNMM